MSMSLICLRLPPFSTYSSNINCQSMRGRQLESLPRNEIFLMVHRRLSFGSSLHSEQFGRLFGPHNAEKASLVTRKSRVSSHN
jgi:hypothetical protein